MAQAVGPGAAPVSSDGATVRPSGSYQSSQAVAADLTRQGARQWRDGEHALAEKSFRDALEILQETEGLSSRRLIEPLVSLGRLHADQGRHMEAVREFERAIGISRRADGLFNLEQLGALEALSDSYGALGDDAAVETARRYTLLVVQQHGGPGDARTLAARRQLADWLERSGDYVGARDQYRKIVETAKTEGDYSPEVVAGLLGVARTYRLQFIEDPGSQNGVPSDVGARDASQEVMMITAQVVSAPSPHREGRQAVLQALSMLDAVDDPPADLLIDTLLEVADWHMISRRFEAAMPFYSRAWGLLAGRPEDERLSLFDTPQPVVFRIPAAARRSKERWAGVLPPRPVEFSMTVTAAGELRDIVVATADAPPGQVGQLRRALEMAIFRPAFSDGEPVDTADYHVIEYWYDATQSDDAGTASSGGRGAS